MPNVNSPNYRPKYRHHQGTGQAVVTLNGRDFYLGKWNSAARKAEYNRRVAEWFNNGRQCPAAEVSPQVLTVVELLAAYLRHAKQYYRLPDGKPTSQINCIKLAIGPLQRLYGRTQVNQFTPMALKVVREEYIQAGVVRSQVNARIHRLRAIFR